MPFSDPTAFSALDTPRAQELARRQRQELKPEQSHRYFQNISEHRPFELQLLRWSHCHGDGTEEGADEEQQVNHVSDRDTFRQLACLGGRYRQIRDPKTGGGISWMNLELAGVFLRHRHGGALVWLPEAGCNLLLQAVPKGGWMLLEVGCIEKRSVIVDQTESRLKSARVTFCSEVAFLRNLNQRARIHEADPHLTDEWLQAAEDLRDLWKWDWRPLRKDSCFELAFPKFVYTPGYPIADVLHGFHGEERWRWYWREDESRKFLNITNHAWVKEEAVLRLSEGEIIYNGVGGEQIVFGSHGATVKL